MFKPILTALMLSLLCGVQGAQSANIPILALPFKITAPGTYVLMGNLTYPVLNPAYEIILKVPSVYQNF